MTYAAQPLPIAPGAKLNIHWPWDEWLAGAGIASYSVMVVAPLVKTSDQRDGANVTAWVEVPAGTPFNIGLVARCTITTDETPPRVDTRRFTFLVTDR